MQVATQSAKMLHTLACSLLLAAAAWPATHVAAEDTIAIPYEVEADGTVPFVDLSSFEEEPKTVHSRALLQLSNSGSKTTTNVDGYKSSSGDPASTGTVKKHSVSSSSVKCVAHAEADSWAASQDAHATAVAFAVKKGCASGKLGKDWLGKVRGEFKERAGFAIAAVRIIVCVQRC